MSLARAIVSCVVVVASSVSVLHAGHEINLQPKYGVLPKDDAHKLADQKFLQAIDAQYGNDRAKAARALADLGWKYLHQRNDKDAMRRFNQAWLLDPSNAVAIWGMAAVQGGNNKLDESLRLFEEVNPVMGEDINFSVGYARTLALAGVEKRNDQMLRDAFSRFARNHAREPAHFDNLETWGMTLFLAGRYADAWEKVALAEKTPARTPLNSAFISALGAKMPRP